MVISEVFGNHNTFTGVQVDTKGAVTLTNIQANDNRYYGLYVDQSDATDSLKPIILNKIIASNKGLDGIHVDSLGSITTNGIRAYSNEHSGMVLNNANTNSTGTITMLNTLGQNMTLLNGQTCVSDVCTPNAGRSWREAVFEWGDHSQSVRE